MKGIGVDCLIAADGQVTVRRIELEGKWQVVEQGRQWLDDQGRHVLLMLPGQQVQEIVFRPETLNWVIIVTGRRHHPA